MPISRKDLIKKFKSLGFTGPYSGDKHQFMVKGKLKIRVPNPHNFLEDLIASVSPEYLESIRTDRDDYKNGRVKSHGEVFNSSLDRIFR